MIRKQIVLFSLLALILSVCCAAAAGQSEYVIHIDVEQKRLTLWRQDELIRTYTVATGAWDTIDGNNFAPNNAYIGWGVYVMKRTEENGTNEAAWDLAAHLGGKDLSLWTACYPSGFQPYRNSHFNIQEWVDATYGEGLVRVSSALTPVE